MELMKTASIEFVEMVEKVPTAELITPVLRMLNVGAIYVVLFPKNRHELEAGSEMMLTNP